VVRGEPDWSPFIHAFLTYHRSDACELLAREGGPAGACGPWFNAYPALSFFIGDVRRRLALGAVLARVA